MGILAWPSVACDVIDVTPAMVENCRSIGPATEAAMVSGLAPGSVAVTSMVGKSTRGSAATASRRYPKMPNTMSDAVMSVVITGRRIQASEMFMSGFGLAAPDRHFGAVGQQQLAVDDDHPAPLQAILDGGFAVDRALHLHVAHRGSVVLHHIDEGA